MTRKIEIPFTANPREFVRGLKVMDDDLDKFQDKLQTIEREGDDVERELGDNFRDLARDADRSFDKVGKSFDKAGRKADDLGDDVGDVEQEAAQSAKEFGASFRGDPVEALEEVQGYLSEIVSSKLPGFAGAVATIAGGAVLGLVVAGVEQWREKQERIAEYADTYLGVLRDGVDGALQSWNRGYDDLIDKQLAMAVLEEASAAQLTDIALLAAARGQSADEYVNSILTGEITTQDQLADIEQQRWDIAGEIARLGNGRIAANADEIAQLHEKDRSLQKQGEALREQGGFLNENVAGVTAAKTAQDQLTRATEASRERQRFLNRATADQERIIDRNTREAEGLTDELGSDVDKDVQVSWRNTKPPRELSETAYKNIFIEWRNIALPDHLTRDAGYGGP